MSVGTVHAAADIPVDLGDVIEFDGITQGDFNDFLGLGLSLASQAELDAYLIDFPNTQTFTRDLTIHPTWDASNAGSTQDVLFELPAAVPEPSTVLLLGSGLAGLVAFRIRRRRVSASQ